MLTETRRIILEIMSSSLWSDGDGGPLYMFLSKASLIT